MAPSPLRRFRVLAPLLGCAVLSLSACDDNDDGGPEPKPPVEGAKAAVMTRNVYLGANIFRLAQAQSPQQVPVVAGQLYATVQATDFPTRAEALADEIQSVNPALVGLQEVSLYRTQFPSNFLSSPTPDAQTVAYDFLAILLEKLQERGLNYRVAAKVENADAELPAALAGGALDLTDLRLTDYDVILARGDVQISGVVEQNYTNNQQVPVGGAQVTFKRGFTKVEATFDGASFTFVNSHLEGLMPANQQQANELVGILASYPRPIILVGDLNTGPGSPTPAYGILTGSAGFTDAWAQVGVGNGFTCCVSETVNDTNTSGFDERIDLVFYAGEGLTPLSAQVVGDLLTDRTTSGLWPSDHAGVVVEFNIAR
ncbi:endonuclease/exonuclease/phosphatase family protein [Pyxidicoccus xibeiensis]|uniref:endonuclease/exonuclease/phosphatase family protein n=1 Tax=Pyxidicoccus xibeiensis TaxID=2906759 RepID=UPI0020A779AF|nr:endonuclease/exonuclease/phosphatase family protein [Pyxidicoccus xibeiensis]MCP3142314.1 endonuclease/exonuclease/phosphatase family protein [Pyxidicoccus xibeiensis]